MTDPSQIFVAKAQRVIDASLRRQAVPRTRSDLLDSGIRHFYESEYGLPTGEAEILASATLTLIQSYKQQS